MVHDGVSRQSAVDGTTASANTLADASSQQANESLQEGKRFLFIGGMHRSGTTMLWECFKGHPSVSGFSNVNSCEDEGQFEQTVYPIDRDYGHIDWPMHPDVHLTETSTLVNESNRRKLTREWYRHWDLTRPVLMEKTPRNLVISRFLQAMFPESSFLFIIRHPVAHAKALQRLGWTSRTVEELIERWIRAHDMFVRDQTYLKRSAIVCYEDFVREPNLIYQRLCQTFDLPSHELQLKIEHDQNATHLADWTRELHQLHVASLRTRSLWHLEDDVRRFGYSLFDGRLSPTHDRPSLQLFH